MCTTTQVYSHLSLYIMLKYYQQEKIIVYCIVC